MYLCICAAVTDRDVRSAVAQGADSLDKLACQLGVGAGCGCCREMAQQMIAEGCCGGHCACAGQSLAAA
jgi:bacterioferritin-associated ferredoxin